MSPLTTASRIVLAAFGLFLSCHPLKAASFALYGDPGFSFGPNAPDVGLMATAIQFRMNIPITVVTALPDENTAFAPSLANSGVPPFYSYGPSANGVIKNLNLNTPIITGLTSGALRSAGFEVDLCGDFVERFVLRLFSGAQFYDVLVRYTTCSGVANVLWSFYEVSSPRLVVTPPPTVSPSPSPAQLVSTASRFVHGAAGTFDLNLPLAGPPGIECRRTIGAAGSYTVVFNFFETLNSVHRAFLSSGVGDVHDSGIGADPHQYIVNLVNVTNAQTIVITLAFVQDSVGHVSNAVNASMRILVGDTTANANVGRGDVRQVQGQLGQPVTTADFRNDVNHDGFIDANDVNVVKKQKGTSVAP